MKGHGITFACFLLFHKLTMYWGPQKQYSSQIPSFFKFQRLRFQRFKFQHYNCTSKEALSPGPAPRQPAKRAPAPPPPVQRSYNPQSAPHQGTQPPQSDRKWGEALYNFTGEMSCDISFQVRPGSRDQNFVVFATYMLVHCTRLDVMICNL